MLSALLAGALGLLAGAAAAEWRRRRKDREREAVFAFAAHELASPTTGIQLTLRNILEGVFGDVPAEQRRWLETSQDQVAWLGGVSSDLGDLAHLELGRRLKVSPGSFDASAAVLEAVGGWKRLAVRWGVGLELEAAPGLGRVRGDAGRLSRVLSNLVGHALRFSIPKGTVKVSAAQGAEDVRIGVEWSPVDPGTAPQEALDRFCVAKGGKTLRISGIGLTVAREIAERCGAALVAERQGDRDRFVLILRRSE